MRVKYREFYGFYNFVIINAHKDDAVGVVMYQYEDINHILFKHLKVWLKFKKSHGGIIRKNEV